MPTDDHVLCRHRLASLYIHCQGVYLVGDPTFLINIGVRPVADKDYTLPERDPRAAILKAELCLSVLVPTIIRAHATTVHSRGAFKKALELHTTSKAASAIAKNTFGSNV